MELSWFMLSIWRHITANFRSAAVYPALIASVLLMVAILSVYEFLIYRVVLRRSLFNKAFHISVTLLPFFISTIILCLQSNMVITLGTIGALAIIRFRTAIKDPIDMIFILWSIHIGITCGCQLYGLAAATSLAVTAMLVILNHAYFHTKSYVLIVHAADVQKQADIENAVGGLARKKRLKSRNIASDGIHLIFEVVTKNAEALTTSLSEMESVSRISLIEYDSDDIL